MVLSRPVGISMTMAPTSIMVTMVAGCLLVLFVMYCRKCRTSQNILVILCQSPNGYKVSIQQHNFTESILRTYLSLSQKWRIAYTAVNSETHSLDVLNGVDRSVFAVEPVDVPLELRNRMYSDLPANVKGLLCGRAHLNLDAILKSMRVESDPHVWQTTRCCDFGNNACRCTSHPPAIDDHLWTYTGFSWISVVFAIVQFPGCPAHRGLAKRLWGLSPPQSPSDFMWVYCTITFVCGVVLTISITLYFT